RRTDFSFRERVLLCSGDTWQLALSQLVRWADVALIDLRGWQGNNSGSRYELAYLFGRLPLDRIVVVVDEESRSADQHLAQQKCQRLTLDSPNYDEPKPTLRFCTITNALASDIQTLIDVLLLATEHEDEAALRQ